MRECEELSINGLRVSEYYRRQILAAVTKNDPLYVGDYSYWQEQYGKSDPNKCYQQTVEGCALVTGLWLCKGQIWDRYSKEEKDRVAEFISSYAHAHTCSANWRLFNMLMLAFLYREGYEIDEELMVDHAQSIVSFYEGSGWYRDGHSFDYYSVWGFQFYAPIWNVWYGYERMPLVAKKFEEYSTRFMENFTDFFDEDGHMFLWGRSCIYRFACIGAFAGNMLLNEVSKDYGCLRRIASGCLLQFISRKDFWEKGVPPLGFYGEFLPCVQRYSCAGSVYWLGKAFMLLYFSKDHPFWTSPERDGVWNIMKAEEVKETVLDGPALAISDHQSNGTAFLRTGKVLKNSKDEQGALLYGRLCFSTKYPVEASPSEDFQ